MLPSLHLPITYSLIVVALGAAVCHAVDPSAQTALLENVHCNEALVWFEACEFSYTINPGPSLRLLLNILLLGQVIETL